MKRISIYIILCLMAIYSQAQSTKQNYRHTRTMLNEAGTSFLDHIEYYDGIGRPYLTVEKGITPDKKIWPIASFWMEWGVRFSNTSLLKRTKTT